MNIVIVSGSFYPNVHPRAFRATELAREFTRIGHKVTEVTCKVIENFDYADYSKKIGVRIINLGVFKKSRVAEVASHQHTLFYKIKRFLIEYLLCGHFFKHGWEICEKLSKLDCWEEADMVIVLSTPVQVHYGFYSFIKHRHKSFLTVFDSGDPFYYSKQTKRAIWFKYIERRMYRKCDYLTIPTPNAIPLYSPIISKEKIKIIPQGFNMRNLNLYSGSFDETVRMAYAGVFYWDIRNPEFIFKYLDECKDNYRFFLYMRYKDAQFEYVLKKYPSFAQHIEVAYNMPHDDLLYELSRMNFLINIENISNTQMPSKLIDYGISKRPIFSCKATNFNPEKFSRFMKGDYDGCYEVNTEDYDIVNVANKFIDLYNEKGITL